MRRVKKNNLISRSTWIIQLDESEIWIQFFFHSLQYFLNKISSLGRPVSTVNNVLCFETRNPTNRLFLPSFSQQSEPNLGKKRTNTTSLSYFCDNGTTLRSVTDCRRLILKAIAKSRKEERKATVTKYLACSHPSGRSISILWIRYKKRFRKNTNAQTFPVMWFSPQLLKYLKTWKIDFHFAVKYMCDPIKPIFKFKKKNDHSIYFFFFF